MLVMPIEVITGETERISDTVRAKAESDRKEAVRLLEVLTTHGHYELVANLAAEADKRFADVKANYYVKRMYGTVAAASRAESLVASGRLSEALAALNQPGDNRDAAI